MRWMHVPEQGTGAAIAHMTAVFASSSVVRAGIAVAGAIVVGRGLGADDFGRWTFCLAWAATLASVLDLGFGVLLTREAARTGRRIGSLIGGALAVRMVLFLPVGALFLAATPWLGLRVEASASLRLVVFVAAGGLCYRCFAAPLRTPGLPVFRTRP